MRGTNLPAAWALAPLGDITERSVDQGGPSGTSEFIYIDISSIDRVSKRILDPKRLPASGAPTRARQRVLPGDVLVSMTRPNLNAVALVPPDLEGSIASTGFHVLRAKGIDPKWLFYLVQSPAFVTAMSNLVQGVVYPAVRPKDVLSFLAPVAPLSEQRRVIRAIEAQLTRLAAATTALKRVRANLKRYRASVLKAACEGRLVPTEAELARREGRDYEPASILLQRILRERRARWEAEELERLKGKGKTPTDDRWKQKYKEPQPPDTSGLPNLPEGWTWTTIGQLGEVTGGLTKNSFRGRFPLTVPYLRVANVYAAELRLDDVEEIGVTQAELPRVLLEKGDLLVVEGNGSRDQIGRVAVWDGSISPCAHQNHLIKVRFLRIEHALYVLTWLLSPQGRTLIGRVASSTSGLYTLSLSKVAAMPVPLPPSVEISRILAEVDRFASIIGSTQRDVERQLVRAGNLRRSILKRAFEGRLVPQDPTDEPASTLLERIRAERREQTELAVAKR